MGLSGPQTKSSCATRSSVIAAKTPQHARVAAHCCRWRSAAPPPSQTPACSHSATPSHLPARYNPRQPHHQRPAQPRRHPQDSAAPAAAGTQPPGPPPSAHPRPPPTRRQPAAAWEAAEAVGSARTCTHTNTLTAVSQKPHSEPGRPSCMCMCLLVPMQMRPLPVTLCPPHLTLSRSISSGTRTTHTGCS